MNTALKVLTAIVVILIFGGLFTEDMDNFLRHAFPAGMLAFAFLWVPFILFYRYDLKTHKRDEYREMLNRRGIKHHSEDTEEEDSRT